MERSREARSFLTDKLSLNLLNNASSSEGIGKFCEITDEELNFVYYGKNF